MLDVLSKVKQAEEAAQQVLGDAQQKAAAIRADANRQGKAILDNAKPMLPSFLSRPSPVHNRTQRCGWKIPEPPVKTNVGQWHKNLGIN